MSKLTSLTASENVKLGRLKRELIKLIKNNQELSRNGRVPISIMLEGSHGIGKTSLVKAIGKELGYKVIFVPVGSFSEAADFTGMPKTMFKIRINGAERDVTKDEFVLLQTQCEGNDIVVIKDYMHYSPPEFIKDIEEDCIIVFDDFYRTNVQTLQALMNVILDQTHVALPVFPKNVNIILTANPTDSSEEDYFGVMLDPAQKTRYITYKLAPDCEAWAEWAESRSTIKSPFINFLLKHREIFDDASKKINPRIYTLWAETLLTVDLNDVENIPYITDMSQRITNSENLGLLFTQFIQENLHELISPQEMFTKPWVYVKPQIINIANNHKNSTAIYGILGIRIVNYLNTNLANASKENKDLMIERLIEILEDSIVNTKDKKGGLPLDTINFIVSQIVRRMPGTLDPYLRKSEKIAAIVVKSLIGG